MAGVLITAIGAFTAFALGYVIGGLVIMTSGAVVLLGYRDAVRGSDTEPSYPSARVMAPASFPGRRALVVILVLLELVLAALTVLGMATGTDQQFDKGFTPLGFVILVQSLGAFVLLVLAAGLRACVMTWRARYAPLVMWFFVGTLAWLVWAFFRLSEYSS